MCADWHCLIVPIITMANTAVFWAIMHDQEHR